MIRFATKFQREDEQPVRIARNDCLAAETVLDTGEGFKITVYLDSNGDFTIAYIGSPPGIFGGQINPTGRIVGKWK
jgi:hypothetical protein